VLLKSLFVFAYEYFKSAAEIPSASLNLSGEIEQGFHYKIEVIYSATKDSYWCREGAYNSAIVKGFFYYPVVENGKHNITIPLNEFSTTVGCVYRPSSLLMHFSSEDIEQTSHIKLLLSKQYHDTLQKNYSPELRHGFLEARKVFCFPLMKPVQSYQDSNITWQCQKEIKDGEITWQRPRVTMGWAYDARSLAFVYDSAVNGVFDLVLDLEVVSFKRSLSLCINPRKNDYRRDCRFDGVK